MEYKGYPISTVEAEILLDILQEIKGMRKDLTKPHEVIEEIATVPHEKQEEVPVEVPIETKKEAKKKPAAKKRTAKGRKPKSTRKVTGP